MIKLIKAKVSNVIAETAEILREIIDTGNESKNYILLNGSDHKIWLIPQSNIRSGLRIYQPGSIKGRAIKKVLPFIIHFKPLLRLLNINKMKFSVVSSIDNVFRRNISENDELIYSFYIGNTVFEANRKVVVQISDGTRILGYAKFSKEETVVNSFKKEIETLNWLYSKGISGIPRVIWSGRTDRQFGFIQSTEKSGKEATVEYLTARHWSFLENINKKTSSVVEFTGSEFDRELNEFRILIWQSKWRNKDLLINAIDYIEKYYANRPMKTAFFHGDFTPWNICCRDDYIFVYDFEYAHRSFPEWMDPFHFITQVGIMTRNLSGDEIYKQFLKQENEFRKYMADPKHNYLCYLIHIICFYNRRWNGTLPEDERSNRVWLRLIEKCYQALMREENYEDELRVFMR